MFTGKSTWSSRMLTVNTLIFFMVLTLAGTSFGESVEKTMSTKLKSTTSVTQSSTFVRCAIQAFGSGLAGKGIQVKITRPAFYCGSETTPDSLDDDITREANFIGDEAEILISLPATDFKLCFLSMSMWATFPHSCVSRNRLITRAEWGFGTTGLGSCRALQQQCGNDISNAAVPYVDMWCKRPNNYLRGRIEEMRLTWAFPMTDDAC